MIKPESSRQQQILTLLLNSAEGMSIDEMAVHLEISRTAVKQHLVALEKQELVQEAALNSGTGGRPARYYSLTTQGINSFPKQYAWFCNLLLDEIADTMSTAELESMMWRLGVKLANSLASKFSNMPPKEKLTALIELMQSLGYHARLDQTGTGINIQAINCVYHDLAQKHPEICQFDLALMTTLLNKPVQQSSCMAKKDCDCRFAIAAGH